MQRASQRYGRAVRVGLGCMRLDNGAPIAAAIDRGVVWLDTARAYEGNETLIASVLATRTDAERARIKIITKVGMTRPNGGWEPDGRAGTIVAQAKASRDALGRVPDLLLLHAPDPNVSLATSIRALLKARDQGLAHAIGLSNPTRRELDELGDDVPIAALEVALGAKHDAAARAGMIAWCRARDVPLFAHTPLGGVGAKLGDAVLGAIARHHGVTPAQVMLAYLVALGVIPIPGARRVETATSAMDVMQISLGDEELARLDERFAGLGRNPPRPPAAPTADVVIIMGMAGAGKSRLVATTYGAEHGWQRLNRDVEGGTLAQIARKLGERLAAGATRVVLDNTYLTRASRNEVLRVAHRGGARVRCIFVDIGHADARINVTTRMLEKHDVLLGGRELQVAARRDPNLMLPNAVARMARDLERPGADEGFASIETIPFVREHAASGAPGAAIAIDADPGLAPADVPLLVFGWRPGVADASLNTLHDEARARFASPGRIVDVAVCTHADGAPTCWCRPPLPGLWLAFARRHGIDPRHSTLVATSPAHRTMAADLGIRCV